MKKDDLDRIWANHAAKNPPVEGTDCNADGDGNDFIQVGDHVRQREPGEDVWKEVPPLAGNL